MMFILLDLDILEKCFDHKNYLNSKKIFDIVYNSSNILCFTKQYISLLENAISNRDAFEALIKELSDANRIEVENNESKDNLQDEFLEIFHKSKISLLLPVVLNDNNNLLNHVPFLIVVNKALPINKHWIGLELLSKNICSICYQEFNDDTEIPSLFQNLFTIPKYLRDIYIFDREQTPSLLNEIKSKNIKYYTFLKSGKNNEFSRKQIKHDLKKNLGGKLKLYYTSNPRKLHERKIIFEDILISIDNSRNNLTTSEPTWEINVFNDKDRVIKWKNKCKDFLEVYD